MTSARRPVAAIALLLAVALAGLLALPPSLAWLAKARAHRATLAAMLRTPAGPPAPALARGVAFPGSAAAAQIALGAACRDIAAHEGALVERIEPRPAPVSGLVAQHIVVSGNARAMLRLIEAIETGTPAIRMPRYRLATGASSRSLRLDADAVMAWTSP